MIASQRTVSMALAAGLLASLGACSGGSDNANKPAAGATGAATGLAVNDARVVLAAVSGNPAAVYFDLAYTGPAGVNLTGVTLEGAGMTMIHDYAEEAGKTRMVMTDKVPLAPGAPLRFAPGGLHVMAMDPGSGLTPGSTAKVTLTLSDGTTTVVEAPVRAAGDER